MIHLLLGHIFACDLKRKKNKKLINILHLDDKVLFFQMYIQKNNAPRLFLFTIFLNVFICKGGALLSFCCFL